MFQCQPSGTERVNIVVLNDMNEKWLHDISRMQRWGWTESDYKLIHRRVVTEVVGNTIHINMHQLFRKSRRSMVVDLYINIPQNLSKSKILASKGYALNQHMLL